MKTTAAANLTASEACPNPLAPFEQFMLVDARPGHPMTFFIECEVEGPFCMDGFRHAVAEAVDRHPRARSRVRFLRGRPHWCQPDVMPSVEPAGPDAWRPFHLERESGIRFVVIPWSHPQAREGTLEKSSAPEDHPPVHRVVMAVHHSVCDGVAATELFGDVWAFYDGRLPRGFSAGRRPAGARDEPAPGSEQGTSIWPFITFRPGALADCSVARRSGSAPEQQAPEPPYETLFLGRESTARLRRRVSAENWSVNDAVVAATMRGACRWNERVTGRAGNVRITVPVSLRLPGSREPVRNELSYAFLDRSAAACRSVDGLARSVAEATRWIMATGAARGFLEVLGVLARWPLLLWCISRVPLCFSTAVVSTIGDPARRMKSGVGTTDRLDAPGGLVIRRMQAVPPLRPGTRVALGVITYGDELALTCLCSAGPEPRDAARQFLALVADELDALARATEPGSGAC